MTRPRNQTNRFGVFDFDEVDESAERESKKYLQRFKNPKKCRKSETPVDRGKFLQFYRSCLKVMRCKLCITKTSCPNDKPNKITICLDVEVEPTSTPEVETSKRAICTEGAKAWEKRTSARPIDVDAEGGKNDSQNDIYDVDAGLPSTSLNYESEEVCKVSRDYEMTGRSYPLTHWILDFLMQMKKAAEKAEVVIPASFIVFGDRFYTEAVIIFSCTCLKIEASVIDGKQQAFSSEWFVDDIVRINSQWRCKVENATVSIVLKSKGSRDFKLANRSSGLELLQFSADDYSWPEREEAIKSLNDKYGLLWNDLTDTDRETAEIAVCGRKGNFSSRPYFPESIKNSAGTSTAVIYPKDDPDAVSLGKTELELLQPETFINDTIIDFYIKYLKSAVQSQEEYRFHFFNSFFFPKLADQDRDIFTSRASREAFERVRMWTKKVDMFQKDYIFIPVNYSLHWSLVVICHPGEVANLKDETEDLPKVPCILHMNSIKGSHRGIKNLFQSYLCEEWKERHCDATDDVLSKFLHLPFISLELPQQQNSYDCGLFLLHYVELFLRDAPDNFSYFRIKDLPNFLNRNWFDPSEASKKRFDIQELIYKILKDQSHNGPSDDEHDSLQLSDESRQETEVQIVDKMYCSTKDIYVCKPHSNMRQEMKVLTETASPKVVLKSKDRTSSFKLSELKISPSSFYGKAFQQSRALHKGNTMSPIQEVEENKAVAVANSQIASQQITGSVAGSHSISSYLDDVQTLETCSSSSRENSVEILDADENEDQNLQEHEVSSVCPIRSDKCDASSVLSEDLEDLIVEDSQDGDDDICEVSMSRCMPPSLLNDPLNERTPDIYIKERGGDSMPRGEKRVFKRPRCISLL